MKRKKALIVIIPLVAWISLSVIRAVSAGGSEQPPTVHPDFQEPPGYWCDPLGCYVPTQRDCPSSIDGLDLIGSPVHAQVRRGQVKMELTLTQGDNINMQFQFFEGDSLIALGAENSIQVTFGNPNMASWDAPPGNRMSGRFKVNQRVPNHFRVRLLGLRKPGKTKLKTIWRSPKINISYR